MPVHASSYLGAESCFCVDMLPEYATLAKFRHDFVMQIITEGHNAEFLADGFMMDKLIHLLIGLNW